MPPWLEQQADSWSPFRNNRIYRHSGPCPGRVWPLGERIFEEKKTANWTKRTRYCYNQRRELSHSYRRVNNDCTVETAYSYDLNHNRTRKNETRYSSNANDQLTAGG